MIFNEQYDIASYRLFFIKTVNSLAGWVIFILAWRLRISGKQKKQRNI